jgi:NhaP-type Na+/H+ or K+/H+ antiporter
VRIRQTLNVESGLNDGIAVPVVMVLLATATVFGGNPSAATEAAHGSVNGLWFAASQISFGPIAGIAIAWPAGWMVQHAASANRINRAYEHFAGLAIALGAFGTAELIGGNGFIAAFTAGLVIGNTTSTLCERLREFAEDEGQLLALISFLVFGAAMLPAGLKAYDWTTGLYIILSLTAIRMVPVALALLGTELRPQSVAFLGWFGPRGLATILFALLLAEADAIPSHERLFHITTLAVAASILVHGMTAAPLAAIYGKWVERIREGEPNAPECWWAPELPTRIRTREQREHNRTSQ